MSTPAPGRAIVDAGLKAFSFDSGLPLVHGRAGAEYVKASDEHGVLRIAGDAPPVGVGERLWLVPGPLRSDRQPLRLSRRGPQRHRRRVWPIEARGALG